MDTNKTNDHTSRTLSDSEVIVRIQAGEKELYEILLRRNNQKLFRVIRSYIKDVGEIEDIMQNTYLKAFEKLDQFKHQAQFSTWLIRIGINETLARIKTKGRYIELFPSENSTTHYILEIPDRTQSNPEKNMIQQEAKQLLEQAIDQLDLKYRTVYIFREIEGMTVAEVAACLNLSPSNVKVRLHRAKEMIRQELYDLSLDTTVFEFGFDTCDALVIKVMNAI